MKKVTPATSIVALTLLAILVLGCNIGKSSTSSGSTSRDSKNSNSSSNSTTSSTSTSSATAPDIAGKYDLTGTNPDGGSYQGTLEVITRGDVYQFRWNAGSQYDGIGVQNGKIVAVAYTTGANGEGCGVVDYDIRGDGSLTGKWGYWGKNEAGTEDATRTRGSGLAGEYDGTGKNPNGTSYKVKISVEPAGSLYRFVWSNNTDGLGIKRGNNVAVGIGGSRCGFVMYEVKSDGSLDGVWGGGGSDKTGTEKAIRQ